MAITRNGFILVVVLLFLSILGLLTSGILEVSLLEHKISVSYKDRVSAFYKAEAALVAKERQILTGEGVPNLDPDTKITSKVIKLEGPAALYHLTATVKYHGGESVVHSTLLKVDHAANDNATSSLTLGRQVFWIESELPADP